MYFFSIKDIDFSDRIRNLVAISGNYSVGTQMFDGLAKVTFEDCLTLIGCDGQYHHVENSCGSYDLMCRTGESTLTTQDITCERDDPCSTAQLVAYGAVALAATTVTVCTLLYHYSRNSTKASDFNKDPMEYDDFPIGSSEVRADLTSSVDSSEYNTPVDYPPVGVHLEQDLACLVKESSTEKPKRGVYWRHNKFRFF